MQVVHQSLLDAQYRHWSIGESFLLLSFCPMEDYLVLGGAEQGNTRPVYIPEIFDPATETWQSNLPASSVPRVYHCVALLLPDGRVWNAGGNSNNGVWELRTSIL